MYITVQEMEIYKQFMSNAQIRYTVSLEHKSNAAFCLVYGRHMKHGGLLRASYSCIQPQ